MAPAIAHMENHCMKFPRFRYLRSAKFVTFTFFSLFLLTDLTGFHFSPVLAPTVNAGARVEMIPSDIPRSGDLDLDWIIFHAGQRQAVDPRLIHAVIKQESNFKSDALSPAGASGLMQLMPGTAKRFDCHDTKDQASNVEAGTRYLAWLLKRFNGDVMLALAAYNAGEGSVDKYQGVPPYPETQSYVTRIVTNYGKTYHPILESEDAKLAFNLIAFAP
jgi:hypothetical protein